MAALRGLFLAGFRHQASHRFALVSGLVTNTFFGLVRTAVFLAVYQGRDEIGSLDVAAALTYVWILQAVFGALWAPWIHELPRRIRTGEWTAELTRPGPLLPRHLAYDLGRTAAILVLRAPVPLVVAGVAFDLTLPTTLPGWVALSTSLALAGVAATVIRFLVGSIAFWTPDFRGVYALVFGPLWLVSGFVVPVEYFPGWLRSVAEAGPLSALLRAPVAVATGRDVIPAVVSQAVWIAVGALACSVVLDRATRRMVVFGG